MNNENFKLSDGLKAAIDEMTDAEMHSLMLDMASTAHWIAILRYCAQRSELAKNGLFTLDPFKDQTQMARLQGLINGLMDLPSAVLIIEEEAKKKEKPGKGAKNDA